MLPGHEKLPLLVVGSDPVNGAASWVTDERPVVVAVIFDKEAAVL